MGEPRGGVAAQSLLSTPPTDSAVAATPPRGSPIPVETELNPGPGGLNGAADRPIEDVRGRLVAHRTWTACQRPAGCSRRAILAADERLRQAYSSAVRAGVARPTLIAYRNRWAILRDHEAGRPGRLVDGYGNLAAQLTHASGRARAVHGARRLAQRHDRDEEGFYLSWD